MPIKELLAELGILPLRAIAFQTVLLLVAIALEAAVLRQRLRIGFQTSMQYAATLNLLATSLGWLVFLAAELVIPEDLRTQIISYVLFNRFYNNPMLNSLPVIIILAGMLSFFATFWVKFQGLEWLLRILGRKPTVVTREKVLANRLERYRQARQGRNQKRPAPTHLLAVLEANALSFTAILLLLLLRNAIVSI